MSYWIGYQNTLAWQVCGPGFYRMTMRAVLGQVAAKKSVAKAHFSKGNSPMKNRPQHREDFLRASTKVNVGGGSVTPLCPHTWHPSGGIFVIAVPRRHRPAIKSPKKPESKNKINVLGRQYENTVSGNELLPASPAPLPLFTDCFAKQSGRHLGTADGLCIYSCHLTETNSWLYFKLGSVILDTLEVAYLYDAWRDLWEVRVHQRKTTPNR